MRIGNLSGRLTLFTDRGAVDVAAASGGRFASDPQAIYEVWDDFAGWASTLGQVGATDFQLTDLQAPTPAPAQVFAIGLNYRDSSLSRTSGGGRCVVVVKAYRRRALSRTCGST